MKRRQMPYWLLAFLFGILVGWLSLVVWDHVKKPTAADDSCDEKINLALGHAILNGLPILDKTLQLASSNRVEDAKSVLANYAWWQLEEAWTINRNHNGALSNDLNLLLPKIYPRLKREIKFESFTNFPKAYLTEMSNFVGNADVYTAGKGQ